MLHPTMLGVVGQQCTGLIFAMFTSPIIHLVSLPKFCISIVLGFSFDDCITYEKLKTKVMQNLGGKQDLGSDASSVWNFFARFSNVIWWRKQW